MHGGTVGLLSVGTFKCSVGSEGPAGTTVALVLDWVHEAISEVINVGGSVLEMTSTASAKSVTSVARAVVGVVGWERLGLHLG